MQEPIGGVLSAALQEVLRYDQKTEGLCCAMRQTKKFAFKIFEEEFLTEVSWHSTMFESWCEPEVKLFENHYTLSDDERTAIAAVAMAHFCQWTKEESARLKEQGDD